MKAEGSDDRDLLQRFAAAQDQDAFGALVTRYGPMVLGVCRRVLNNSEEAEDAFQITFLVLARKAGTLEKPELLANWLYGVAYRSALRVRGRRKRREKQVASMPDRAVTDGHDGQEVLAVLDEELNRLPESYRILLVLCYLEGKTHEEAARTVGCPLGSMSWRLQRARDLLRRRLAHRGLVLTAGLPALLLFAQTAHAATLPARLASATTRAATGYAAGQAAGTSARVVALADQILRTLARKRWGRRALAAALTTLLFLLAGALLAYQARGGGPASGPTPAPAQGTAPAGGCGRP